MSLGALRSLLTLDTALEAEAVQPLAVARAVALHRKIEEGKAVSEVLAAATVTYEVEEQGDKASSRLDNQGEGSKGKKPRQRLTLPRTHLKIRYRTLTATLQRKSQSTRSTTTCF